jgi:type I restriction enzyme S subunit
VFGATVDELEPKHLAQIPVPMGSDGLRTEIHDLIVEAYAHRDQAQMSLDAADAQLHALLGLSPFSEEDIEYLPSSAALRAFTIPAADASGRFDASQHVPVARSAVNKLRTGRLPLQHLHEVCERIYIPPRFKRDYVDQGGVGYLLPSQLLGQRRYGSKRISERQAKLRPEFLLTEGELLLTTDGTIGRCHPVTRRMAGQFGSNNMARLWDARTDMGYLYAFLSTPYGQHQVAKEIYGGVVDHITEKHIGDVLCPTPAPDDQTRIGDLVRRGFMLKDTANDLEDRAIEMLENAVDTAISQGS